MMLLNTTAFFANESSMEEPGFENSTSLVYGMEDNSTVAAFGSTDDVLTTDNLTESLEEQIGDMDNKVWDIPHFENMFVYGIGVEMWFGTLGNVLSFIILQRRQLRRHSTNIYLSALAVVDTLVLWVINQDEWCHKVFGRPIINIPCNIRSFCVAVIFCLSSWIIVGVTIERFIAVRFPLKAVLWNTRKRARTVILTGTFCIVAFYIVMLWAYKETPTGCFWSDGFKFYVQNIAPQSVAVMRSILPGIIIILLNVNIIRALLKNQNKMATISNLARRSQVQSVTISVLSVSIAHVILTLPVVLVLSIQSVKGNYLSKFDTEVVMVIQMITEIVSYLNHSINFILYMSVSSQFRKEAVAMICCGRNNQPSSSLNSAPENKPSQSVLTVS